MFKLSKIFSRLVMLGVLSGCLGFALIGNSNKVEAGEPCPDTCVDGLVCRSKYIPMVGCVQQLDRCYPPDYDWQCPIE